MSDRQDKSNSNNATIAKLQICFYSDRQGLCDAVCQLLRGKDYELKVFDRLTELNNYVIANYEQIDCLVLSHERLDSIATELKEATVLLPTVILLAESASLTTDTEIEFTASIAESDAGEIYHRAEIKLYPTQLREIRAYISLAINKFISLATDDKSDTSKPEPPAQQKSLIFQQRRLTEKLKERLGYLGFFYKRDRDHFWTNLSEPEQARLIDRISLGYRQILLLYFEQNSDINRLIDEFVDRAFFADLSTSQILEIHMELMDDFSHQLKIEGRSDEILLDYRLPLIDIISHLCEMYRRSVPNANGTGDLLLTLE